MRSAIKSAGRAALLLMGFAGFLLSGCKKQSTQEEQQSLALQKAEKPGHLKQTRTFSSEVPIKWLQLLLRINQAPPGTPGADLNRIMSYSGVALYESVVNGMPSYQTLYGQLNEMPEMPKTIPGYAYHWAASANASLAYIIKNLLPGATLVNKASVDSLENALNTAFKTEVDAATFERSQAFGLEVGKRIFDWSKTDGSLIVRPVYIPPVGPGLWAPTPPNFPAAVNPYVGLNRLMVAGSGEGAEQPRPPLYSTDPSSDYYAMVKEVYDISQHLTPEQKAIALFYRDNPGYPGAHYSATLYEVLKTANAALDVSAEAFAKAGIGSWDAGIACFKAKYKFNVERPIKYIREVLGHPTWLPMNGEFPFVTPGHPEFPSAHSVFGGATMAMLTSVFGDNFQFEDHSYDYLGTAHRSYSSLNEVSDESSISRLYAGIHYRYSVEKGVDWGREIAANILLKLKFQKE